MLRLIVPQLIFILTTGCAGFVTGDFRDIADPTVINRCKRDGQPYKYTSEIKANLENDGGTSNPAGILTFLTLGLIPTYWYEHVSVSVPIYKMDTLMKEYKYSGGIHKVYGIAWMIPFWIAGEKRGINTLPANEGVGIAIKSGISRKVIARTYTDAKRDLGIEQEDMCFKLSQEY